MKLKIALCIGVLALGSASEVNSAEMLLDGIRSAVRQGARTLRYPMKNPHLLYVSANRASLARLAFGGQATDLSELPESFKKADSMRKMDDLSGLSENLKKAAAAKIGDPSKFLEGLEEADKLAEKVVRNCVSKLPSDDPIKICVSNFSGTIIEINKIANNVPDNKRKDFMKMFPGSGLDRALRDSLNELRILAHQTQEIDKYSGAYENIEKVVDILGVLGIDALAFPKKVMAAD